MSLGVEGAVETESKHWEIKKVKKARVYMSDVRV
jgi:hypothetical protein